MFKKSEIILIFILIILGVFLIGIKIISVGTSQILMVKDLAGATLGDVTAEKNKPQEIVLAFGGDVMLSRVVGQKITKYNDYSWPFRAVAEILSGADLAIVNLESQFLQNSKNYFVPTGSFSFKADPRTVSGLKLAGIDVVSLANNHFGNQGERGMADTFEILKNNHIDYLGAGKNIFEAHKPVIREIKGIKFGFLAYGYPEDLYTASTSTSGIANMNLARAKEDIKKTKEQTQITIVLMHAGTEYISLPNAQQKEFAYSAIDAGADAVVGHHPHWVQQMEIYQGKPIIYSLGNLVFDQMWSLETREGAVVKIYFQDDSLEQLEIIPVRIEDYGQPKIIGDQEEKQAILLRMGQNKKIINFEKK